LRRFLPLLLLLTACATAVPDDPSLRVMTFNIRLNLASDGANAWPHRKDAVADLVRAQSADLLGLQEALPEQLADLDARLPRLARFGDGRSADRLGEFTAIYYRKDRFDLLGYGTFWLSETPEVAGSKGWDAAYERIVTWGKLTDRQSGATFFYFNTHFDHVGKTARRESARLLMSRIAQIAGSAPVIVTGDFNDLPQSEAYATITAGGLTDAMLSTRSPHQGPSSTWNAFKAIEPGRRIDFIFTRGFDVLSHAILPDRIEGDRFPSDHLPVIAEVRIGD
jgi:endonuclease/exonuclease/phosphatase family metal-dependent hydrolase